MGGKKVLRVFLKGNDDLSDSLLGKPEERHVRAHALENLLQEKYQGVFTIELTHEPCARSDILLQQLDAGVVPEELRGQDWGKDADFLAPQFHTRLFEGPSDIVVLSVQPEVAHSVWRHRRSGYLLSPPPRWRQDWAALQKTWLAENFVPLGLLPAAQFKENLARLIRAVKERLDAHVLIYNASTVEPDDQVHNFHSREDTWALRTHKFNLALMELAALEGISFIDVERLVAERGACRHVLQAGRYSHEVNEAIRREFLRVLEDIGFYENRPLVMQVGREKAPCS
jgi:hypothetical protein